MAGNGIGLKSKIIPTTFLGIAITTLVFAANMVDPFNAAKFWILGLLCSWLLGQNLVRYFPNPKTITTSNPEIILYLFLTLFLIALLMDLLSTDVKFTGILGAYKRQTGFLTYLEFALVLLTAARFTKLSHVRILQLVIFSTSSIMTIYGVLQHFHHDFINWNNPLNPVITTLGNPDFSSAVLGIFVVSAFGRVMNFEASKLSRSISAILGILMLVVIKFSAVTQGFLAALVGCGFIFLVWAYQKSKILGRVSLGIFSVSGILIILATLQIGPLTNFIFKRSITYRGDYWRAGMKMFWSHPIFGVGLDRYGAYFGQYRDATQVLRRGPGILSNAAHNVWIQIAATGGLVLLTTYLSLMIFIGWRAVIALKSSRGNKQIVVATVVGLWLTYQAQAFISIDNIGVAVWGWLFGGMIIAISTSEASVTVNSVVPVQINGPRIRGGRGKESGKDNFVGNFASVTLLLSCLVGVSLLARSEVGMQDLRKVAMPKTQQGYVSYQQQVDSVLAKRPVNPYFVESIAVRLSQIGQSFASTGEIVYALPVFAKSNLLLTNLIKEDPRNLPVLQTLAENNDVLAQIYSSQRKMEMSIAARNVAIDSLKKMCELDPYNSTDWLQLGKAYKAAGDMASAKSVIAKIEAFDPKGADLASAKKEFGA